MAVGKEVRGVVSVGTGFAVSRSWLGSRHLEVIMLCLSVWGLTMLLFALRRLKAASNGPMTVDQALPKARVLLEAFQVSGTADDPTLPPNVTNLFEDKINTTSPPWDETKPVRSRSA